MAQLSPAEAIERAQGVSQSGVVELIRAQQAKIINRLVGAYHGGTLTDRDAAIGIATIAGHRTLLSDMDRTVRQGVAAASQLTRDAT